MEKWLITERLSEAGAWAVAPGQSFWSHFPGGSIELPGAWGAKLEGRKWLGWRGCEVAGPGAAEFARRHCRGAAFCSPCVWALPAPRCKGWALTQAWTVRWPDFQSLRFPMCYTGWEKKSHCCSCPTRLGNWRSVLGSDIPLAREWKTEQSPSMEIVPQVRGRLLLCVLLVKL